jgi:long-chain acyl-CoA synthetase
MSYKEVEALGEMRHQKEKTLFESLVFAVKPDDIYDIMFTSGTSGLPKGAMCSQRGPVVGARSLQAVVKATRQDSWLSYLPLSHAFERIMSIAMHLSCGYVVNFADSIDTVQMDVVEIQPTIFGAVPRILEKVKTGVDIRMGKSTRMKKILYEWALEIGIARVAKQRKDMNSFQVARVNVPVSWAEVQVLPTQWTLPQKLIFVLVHFILLRHLRKHMGLLHARYVLCGAAPMSAELFEY